ncbi:FG-GAP and VCBS repeat-containing protein [Streptomyces sp. NPDC005438]|uniref:FG-GAP and VCBS repeat-containing protein n=1 Tax=Streptomyces sp. NPDC005438 TaxID=3156880 RepID=UPI0033BE5470
MTALVAGVTLIAVPAGAVPGSGGEKDGPSAKRPAGVPPMVDINNDGYGDSIISAPWASANGKERAGYVAIVYGSAKGADPGHRQIIHRDLDGIEGEIGESGYFGKRTVARDFDGDGFTDVAVQSSASGNNQPTILWGGEDGITSGSQIDGAHRTWGAFMTAGDFDGDGNVDLVARNLDLDGGQFRVLYGPFDREGKPRRGEVPDFSKDKSIKDVVAGDVNGDGRDDLFTMHNNESLPGHTYFWKGGADGLSVPEKHFDKAVHGTVGDVDGDGYGDLVVRLSPHSLADLPSDPGRIKVLYGSKDGPGERSTTIDQDTPGVPGTSETSDQFGTALTAGDVNGDGYADIGVGVPGEGLDKEKEYTGAVVLLKGSKGGLSGTGSQAFHQDTPGVPGVAEWGDHFGTDVTLRDTDGDGLDDLAIGAPREDHEEDSTGAAWVLRGSGGGLTPDGVVSFWPALLGMPQEKYAQFGIVTGD